MALRLVARSSLCNSLREVWDRQPTGLQQRIGQRQTIDRQRRTSRRRPTGPQLIMVHNPNAATAAEATQKEAALAPSVVIKMAD
jgi:hypothetical protein